MNKITNWVFGSFFRTLGRILVYLLLGFILSYLLKDIKLPKPKLTLSNILFANVYADSINIRQTADGYLLINESANEYQTYIINPNTNATLRIKIATALSESDIYSYMFMDVCSTKDIDAVRTSSPGQSCTNSCWSNQVYTEKTNYLCTTNAQNGQIYRITTPIQKWEKDYNDEMAYVNDQITIRNSTNDIISTTIYGVYVSNDTNNGSINIDYTNIINNIGNRQITAIDATTSAVNNVAEEARQNTEDIIDNQTENTQDIIDNQNTNTQAQIDSQKVCKKIDKNNTSGNKKYIDNNGVVQTFNDDRFSVTDYIKIESSTIKVLSRYSSSNVYYCFYNVNKEKISCDTLSSMTVDTNLTIPDNATYFRTTINISSNRPTFEICTNGNQAVTDTLTDTSGPSNIGALSNSAGWLPAGPVDSILNLPLSFLTNLSSNLSKSCQPVDLPLPYINKTLPLPCVNSLYAEIEGLPTWINTIGIIASAFILFGYLINLYKYIDDTLTFRENNYIDNWSSV